jgi:integrase/recombinase XerD
MSGSLVAVIVAWIESLAVQHYSAATLRARQEMGLQFAEWCAERDVILVSQVTRPLVERYQAHLFYLREERSKKPLSVSYQNQRIACVQYLFRWAVRKGHVGANPAADIDRPRDVARLPDWLTPDEMAAILAVPDVGTPLGVRDRAILELLYSTGIRRTEAVRLGIYDLEASQGLLRINQGKGGKDRVVPIGDRALSWLHTYIDGPRALWAPLGEQRLFLTERGAPFQPEPFGQMVRRYLDAAGITKTGACHLFRHTMATQLLEGGCDVRLIQAMLGHAKLDTTAMYTHVGIGHLKRAHTAHHPAENPPQIPPQIPPQA